MMVLGIVHLLANLVNINHKSREKLVNLKNPEVLLLKGKTSQRRGGGRGGCIIKHLKMVGMIDKPRKVLNLLMTTILF